MKRNKPKTIAVPSLERRCSFKFTYKRDAHNKDVSEFRDFAATGDMSDAATIITVMLIKFGFAQMPEPLKKYIIEHAEEIAEAETQATAPATPSYTPQFEDLNWEKDFPF